VYFLHTRSNAPASGAISEDKQAVCLVFSSKPTDSHSPVASTTYESVSAEPSATTGIRHTKEYTRSVFLSFKKRHSCIRSDEAIKQTSKLTTKSTVLLSVFHRRYENEIRKGWCITATLKENISAVRRLQTAAKQYRVAEVKNSAITTTTSTTSSAAYAD
jgi:hypothetical protein